MLVLLRLLKFLHLQLALKKLKHKRVIHLTLYITLNMKKMTLHLKQDRSKTLIKIILTTVNQKLKALKLLSVFSYYNKRTAGNSLPKDWRPLQSPVWNLGRKFLKPLRKKMNPPLSFNSCHPQTLIRSELIHQIRQLLACLKDLCSKI